MSPFENQVPMVTPEDVILLSTTPSSSADPKTPSEVCEVCGDRVNSRRYGASACLGCTVFFRRAIVNKMQYRCLRDQNCLISHTYRCACRYCRFQKCLRVGMRPGAIQRRDLVGPRKSSREEKSTSPELIIIDDQSDSFLQEWASFQRSQCSEHLQYFAGHQIDVAFHKDSQNFVKFRRRARAPDVNIMLKLALKQASEWGNRLKPFKKLSSESKKSILAEYCLAFLLIDQGFKTSKEADLGIWLLQNGSFMHPDYFFGLSANNASVAAESMRVKIQLHQSFVTELLTCVSNPFRKLEIDEVECAALKTILLLTPSCSKRAIYAGQEGVLAGIYTKCMEELMEHSMAKYPESGAERFGEIILLIGSIRCGVKTIYNQTRVSDLFNFMKFDDSVKDILLT